MGAEVVQAENGREALEKLEPGAVDAVLLDLQMPEMDGFQTARAIRARQGCAELPIVALTAHALDEIRAECFSAGMNDHLAKPVDPQGLARTLLALLPPLDQREKPAKPPPARPRPRHEGGLPDSLSGLDVRAGLKLAQDDVQLYGQLLEAFSREFGSGAQRALDALARHDYAEVSRAAHAVKGAARVLAASDLAAAALALEMAAREERVQELAQLAHFLDAQIKTVLESARQVLQALAQAQPP